MNFKAIQNLKTELCLLTQRVDELETAATGGADMIYLENVSSFVGGTPSDLDSTPTVGVIRPKLYFFVSTDPGTTGLKVMRFRNGSEAESVPAIVRPDDFNASNPAVFELVL